MTMIWNCTLQKMCPDIKQFFSLSKFPLELSAPCSTSRSAFLSMEAKKKKCNCKQQHVCFSQPGFPLWNWGEIKKKKERNVFELLWALWCNARWFFFISSLPTANTLRADLQWPVWETCLSVCFCPWNCIWVEDKPLGGVCKAMMFVDHAAGNSAD